MGKQRGRVAVTLDIFQDHPGPVAVDILDSFANRKSIFGGVLRPYPQRQVAPVIFHPINGQPFGQSSQSFTGEQRVPMKSVAEFYMASGIPALQRSEDRPRVTECVSTCGSRWWSDTTHNKTKLNK